MNGDDKTDFMEDNSEDDITDNPDVLVENVDDSNASSTVGQSDEDKHKTDVIEVRKRESSDEDDEANEAEDGQEEDGYLDDDGETQECSYEDDEVTDIIEARKRESSDKDEAYDGDEDHSDNDNE